MPRVPIYEQQVREAPIPQVRIPGGGFDIAGAMAETTRTASRFGAQVQDVLERQREKEQQEADIFRVEAQVNKLRQLENDLTSGENGFVNVKGENIYKQDEPLPKLYDRRWNEGATVLEQELANENQRKLFQIRAGKLKSQFVDAVGKHERAEIRAARKSTFEGIISTETEAAASALSDPDPDSRQFKINSSIGRLQFNARNYFEKELGLGKERAEAEILKFESNIHANIVSRALESKNYVVAELYFDANKDRMEQADRVRVVSNIETVKKATQLEAEKVAKERKEDLTLRATIGAIDGKMTLGQLNQMALDNRFTAEQYNQVRRAMEEGGVTDPRAFSRLESDIRSGRMLNYQTILNHPALDRTAKSSLMGLITSRKDHLTAEARTKHFSKLPEYDQATREYRAAISAKGPLESLSDLEQRQYLWGLRQLWDRTEKGEDPLVVSREVSFRARQAKDAGLLDDGPVAMPKFTTPQELAEAFKSGRIDRRQFDGEALLFEQKARMDQALENRRKQREQQPQRERRGQR